MLKSAARGLGLVLGWTWMFGVAPSAVGQEPIDLNTWSQKGPPANGNWVVVTDGSSVLQTINGNPTMFVSPNEFINTTIRGRFRVETTSDDDFIGFVFGFQAPDTTTNDFDLILFDWKQANQNDATFGNGLEGLTLSRVIGNYTSYPPFWGHTDTGPNPTSGPVFDVWATDYSTTLGWADNTDYDFELIYQDDRIAITLTGGSADYASGKLIFDITPADVGLATFPTGRFGFYNFSQSNVRYVGFTEQDDAILALNPTNGSTIDVGPVRIGDSKDLTLSITNVGGSSSMLTGTVAPATGEFSGPQPDGAFTLAQQETSNKTFTFGPLDHGGESQLILVTSNGGDGDVTLAGGGVGPIFASDAAPLSLLDFGTVGSGGVGSFTLTVDNASTDNTGNDALDGLTLIDVEIAGADASRFSLPSFAPGTVVSAGASYPLTIEVTPAGALGSLSASILIKTDEGAAFGALGGSYGFDLGASSVPLADLIASNVGSPAQQFAGMDVTATWDESNIGSVDATGPWVSQLYLSPNAAAGDGDEIAIGAPLMLDSAELISPAGSAPRSHAVTIPLSVTPGTYYVAVRVDDASAVAEDSDANNWAVAATAIQVLPEASPDVLITQINPPAVAFDGDPTQVQWTVSNGGTLDIPDGFTFFSRVSLSTDTVPGGDVELGVVGTAGPLNVGDSVTETASFLVPAGLSGEFYVIVEADAAGNVVEKHGGEDNNLTVAIAPTLVVQNDLPDLAITQFDSLAAPPVFTGQSVTLTYRVDNLSTEGTASGQWIDRIYLSTDATFDPPSGGMGDLQVFSSTQTNNAFGPGDSYVRLATFAVPATAGTYWFFAQTDVTGNIAEAEEINNLVSLSINVVDPAYTGTIQTAVDEALSATVANSVVIPMSGQAVDNGTGQPVPNVPITVRVVNKGTTRVFSMAPGGGPLTTDGQGSFAFNFTPVPGEAGLYKIYADHPAVKTNDPAMPMDTFVLKGVSVSPTKLVTNVKEGASAAPKVTLKNLGDTTLDMITGQPLSGADGPVSWLTTVPSILMAQGQSGSSGSITYDVTSSGLPAVPGTPSKIVTDVFVPVEGVPTKAATSSVDVFVMPLVPTLTASPASIGSSSDFFEVPLGKTQVLPVSFHNAGEAAATGIHVFLSATPNPEALAWIHVVTPANPAPLAPGEDLVVELAFQFPGPPTLTPDQIFTGSLRVDYAESTESKVVPFFLRTSSDLKGSLEVRVEDELTYYGLDQNGDAIALNGAGPLLQGASIKVIDALEGGLVMSQTTGASGVVQFNAINEAFYKVQVSAPKHGDYSTIVQINPGQQTVITAFLPSQKVTYEWTVVPTEIDDEYSIFIEAVFETFVPVPVVTVKPELVSLETLAIGETIQVDYKIKNHGLIAAQGVELDLGNPPGFDVVPIATDFGTLGAGEEIVVPTTITRTGSAEAGGGGGCTGKFSAGVRWYLICNGQVWYWVPIYYSYLTGCPPGGGGGGSASGGGSAGDPYVPPPDLTTEQECEQPPIAGDEGPPPCPDGTTCCDPVSGSSGSGPPPGGDVAGGSNPTKPVNLFSGEEVLSVTDLSIPGRGMDFVWTRRYRSKIGPHTAMGQGWDYGYGGYVERVDTKAILHDGRGRADVFSPASGMSNTWVRDEFFSELTRSADGTYTLTQPDLSRRHYHPVVTGSPMSGKLAAIEDKNGNTIELFYDAQGRLATLVDTLGRAVVIAYNPDGYIESVTDFAGRSVRYDYYQDGDPDGAAGDLKSVTSPAVVGTSNGNDYPQGKTTVYTYSTGFNDDRLNHNLLTVTDPKGQVFVRNTYHSTEDPHDRQFDRVVTQEWGDAGDRIDLVYVPTLPTIVNGQSVMTTIVNDREGHVTEFDFDLKNRLIARREFTGAADPDAPTTLSANRPKNKARPGDPPVFETKWGYNLDSMVTQIVHPNGNLDQYVYEVDLNPQAPARTRGNLRIMRHFPGSHTPVGDQPMIEELFEYEDGFGACCGNNFVRFHTDARGNVTEFQYDGLGNLVATIHPEPGTVENWEFNEFGQVTAHVLPDNGSGHRRRDESIYYASGPQMGYVQSRVVDAGGLALTAAYEYDLVGNVVRMIDPRGNDTLYELNALDQVITETSREVTIEDVDGSLSNARYRRVMWYDANDNVARVDTENANPAADDVSANGGSTSGTQWYTTLFDYETLNHVTRIAEEEGDVAVAANVTSVAQLANLSGFVVTEFEYDASRLRTVMRSGAAVAGDDPFNTVTTVYDERDLPYRIIRGEGDPNVESVMQIDYDGNRNRVREIDGANDPSPRVTQHTYDAYDRLVSIVDAMGNETVLGYDPNGNRTRELSLGDLVDQPGGAGNARLAETSYSYDAMDRLTVEDRALFDPATQQDIGDGHAITTNAWSPASLVVSVTDDNGHVTQSEFDTANRVSRTIDVAQNETLYAYDANSNVTAVTEIDKSDLGEPDETFVTTHQYDQLDRMVATVDNLAQTDRAVFDSRSNRVASIDARGNVTLYTFDGLKRELATLRLMTPSGVGGGAVVDTIVTEKTWDKASRLVGQRDDNGNVTAYAHDALNRTVSKTYADGTVHQQQFNVFDDIVRVTDANQTVVDLQHDELGRVVRKDVAPGPGVSSDTTFVVYTYDGLSRLVAAEDDDALVERGWDSLGRLVRDAQDGVETTQSFDGVGNPLSITYPSGAVFSRQFDELDRVRRISDGGDATVTQYDYAGRDRPRRRTAGNGAVADYAYDAAKRLSQVTVVDGGQVTIDDRTYGYDPAYNLTDLSINGVAETFGYDSANRMTASSFGGKSYQLDGAGNRLAVSTSTGTDLYTLDAGAPAMDAQVNQYTTVPAGTCAYDARGNLRSISGAPADSRSYEYDFENQLVRYSTGDGAVDVAVAYDPLGRRVRSTDVLTGTLTVIHSCGPREIERSVGGVVTQRSVFGDAIDELVYFETQLGAYHTVGDHQHNVVVATGAGGQLVERYRYDDFGAPAFEDGAGASLTASAIGSDQLYAGRPYLADVGLYYFRTRYLDAGLGRFLTRDLIGLWGDPMNAGNAYAFIANNPRTYADPFGLQCEVRGSWAPFPHVDPRTLRAGSPSVELIPLDQIEGKCRKFLGIPYYCYATIAKFHFQVSGLVKAGVKCVSDCPCETGGSEKIYKIERTSTIPVSIPYRAKIVPLVWWANILLAILEASKYADEAIAIAKNKMVQQLVLAIGDPDTYCKLAGGPGA